MFDQAPGFIAILRGPDHVYEVVNRAYYQLVGPQDLLGRPVREVFPALARQGYIDLLDEVYATGKPFVGHQRQIRFQPSPDAPEIERYVDFVYQPLIEPDGTVSGIFLQGQDVTEQHNMQEALRRSEERWKLAIEGARDGVWDWKVNTGEVELSKQYKAILGYEELEFPNLLDEWTSRIHPEDRSATIDALMETLRTGTPFHAEYRLRCKNGSYKWVLSRGVIVARDQSGCAIRLTGTMSDISERKETEEIIWRHASFCSLTGLPNRRLFQDRLEQEVRKAHREGDQVALLFIDLDRFKEVNDSLGHEAGDRLLSQVARRLLNCVREGDTVARLGGDEFTVILTDLHDSPKVEVIAQKIIDRLAEPFRIKGETAHVSASVGITLYPCDAADSQGLIRNADQAMYAAKNGERNQFRFFQKQMRLRAQKGARLVRDLRAALPAGQMMLHFQPVVDLSTAAIVKAEALLRWRHPKQGLISPDRFIPAAEESGLIHDIGDWAFVEAATWAARWGKQRGGCFEISVNRSPVQFHRPSGVDWVHVIEQRGLPASSIVVEITEGVLLNASERVADALCHYRDAGIQVALDDFGTGYSSLAYLQRFHIDYLKIDRSFVHDLEWNEGSRAITESMIAMAHRLGLKVIAEGIEKPEQEAILRHAGCDYGQGFLFSKPVPPQVFEHFLV
ncbi:diguanylate cyclase/phosphodiesterase with PAS/PAC sensor(s) [Noviherbaspirillum humi]|uniref:Diguanylate cyclase/phosphodiesterase with PAS/PAC sensor(S) n=2 Tax=Noviherbaspirillum humi TaxID=1688639 RepID=A0A239IHL5_9BURK|nr:diguanylate cyclase/phosphodiesterase with PAS/PAC sensor(s) [Noviherbaspirillum humi]